MWVNIVIHFLVLQQAGWIVSSEQPYYVQRSFNELRGSLRYPFNSHQSVNNFHNPVYANTNWTYSPMRDPVSEVHNKIPFLTRYKYEVHDPVAVNAYSIASQANQKEVGFKRRGPEGKHLGPFGGFGFDHGHHGFGRHHQRRVPFISANGCTRVGDFVCFSTTDRCSYNRCVLTSENSLLLGIPSFTVVQVACPAGTGLPANFCNFAILRVLGNFGGHGHGHRHHGHRKHRHHIDNPCILRNTACSGTLTDVVGVVPVLDVTQKLVTAVTVPSTGRPPRTLFPQTALPRTVPTPTRRLPRTTPKPQFMIPDTGCPHPFLKFAGRHSQGGTLAPDTVNTEEECKRFCLVRPQCRAIDFDHTWHRCYTYTFSTQTFVMSIKNPIVDHYLKTSCHYAAGAKHGWFVACFPGYNVNGGSLIQNVDNIEDCQIKCGDDSKCQGIDFDSGGNSCWFHTVYVCRTLNPHETSQHCRKRECDSPGNRPDIPDGYSQVSVGYQQKGGVHLTAQYSRSGCLDTCLASKDCWAVDYNIADGTCWHIKEGCGELLPVASITNYRKQGITCDHHAHQTHQTRPTHQAHRPQQAHLIHQYLSIHNHGTGTSYRQ